MQKYEQAKKLPEQHHTWVPFGDFFYSLSKPNRYLAAILQGIHQAVIVVYGYVVNHSFALLFNDRFNVMSCVLNYK
jgi:hypothetical protein